MILESAESYRTRAHEQRQLRDDAERQGGQPHLVEHHSAQAALADDSLGSCRQACHLCGDPIADSAQSWFWRTVDGDLRAHLSCFRDWYRKGLAEDAAVLSAYDDGELKWLWMTPRQDEVATYENLRAVIVDAIRYVTTGQPIEQAADEVLTRLRGAGLPIPPPTPGAAPSS